MLWTRLGLAPSWGITSEFLVIFSRVWHVSVKSWNALFKVLQVRGDQDIKAFLQYVRGDSHWAFIFVQMHLNHIMPVILNWCVHEHLQKGPLSFTTPSILIIFKNNIATPGTLTQGSLYSPVNDSPILICDCLFCQEMLDVLAFIFNCLRLKKTLGTMISLSTPNCSS